MEAFVTYRSRIDTPDNLQGTPEDMPVADFQKVLDFIGTGRAPQCVLRGNEATLHPEFPALVEMVAKKNLGMLLETTGLMPDPVAECVAERRLPLLWRLYQKPLYSDPDWEEMTSRLKSFAKEFSQPLRLLALTHDVSIYPEAAVRMLRELPLRDITFRVVRGQSGETMRPYTAWLTQVIQDLVAHGCHVVLDCGVPPCAFSDADFGALAKLGIKPGSCDPRPGVRPDLRVYHCHQMVTIPGATLAMFKRPAQLVDYFYRRHNDLQWDLRAFPRCVACPSLHTRACGGECMAVKAQVLLTEYDQLREKAERDADSETLCGLGRACYELARFREAEAYLIEARRLEPANAQVHLLLARTYWETGKYKDAEEEFRKVARLVPDGKPVMLELLNRMQEKGSLLKTRRLAEEIKRMPDANQEAHS